jgi:hypothetical protein
MTYLEVDSANVSWERLAGEVIAIQLATGHYYSMGGTAADLWSLLVNGANADSIMEKMSLHFTLPDDAKTQIEHFLDNALAVGLLKERVETAQEAAALPEDHQRDTWVPPIIQEYTDLQDLILVDPVHDTKPTGWPDLKQE